MTNSRRRTARDAYALDDYADPWRPVDTVILVHAAMGSSVRFYAWVPCLARDFRVVRIDMRGHGATQIPGPGQQLTVERLAQDVVELADHIGAPRFHVAVSSGALLARQTAIDYPTGAELGAFALHRRIRHGLRSESWGESARRGCLHSCRHDADRVDLKSVEPGFVDWFIAESARTPVAALERFVPMMRQFDFVADLHRIRCPTLAVAPGGDPIHTLDHYRALPEKIPDCEFVIYEGLPHNITDAAPDRCAADYRRFLLKQARAARQGTASRGQ